MIAGLGGNRATFEHWDGSCVEDLAAEVWSCARRRWGGLCGWTTEMEMEMVRCGAVNASLEEGIRRPVSRLSAARRADVGLA